MLKPIKVLIAFFALLFAILSVYVVFFIPERIDKELLYSLPFIKYGNGKQLIYVISDPLCPYCRKQHKEIEKLLAKNKNVQVRYVLYPLSIHKYSKDLAATVYCYTGEERRKILDEIFKFQNDKDKIIAYIHPCEYGIKATQEIKKVIDSFDLKGVPTLILPNGKVITGLTSAKNLEKLLEEGANE